MKVVDANVLLYAVNESAEHHDEAVSWLDATLNGRSTVGSSWISLLAFLRLSTKIGRRHCPWTRHWIAYEHGWPNRQASCWGPRHGISKCSAGRS